MPRDEWIKKRATELIVDIVRIVFRDSGQPMDDVEMSCSKKLRFFVADALREAHSRAVGEVLEIIEDEEELLGEPPKSLQAHTHVEVARAAVRATKKSIAARVASGRMVKNALREAARRQWRPVSDHDGLRMGDFLWVFRSTGHMALAQYRPDRDPAFIELYSGENISNATHHHKYKPEPPGDGG